MWITLLAAVMIMAAYFLILYGGVGFVQDKRFFSSAPKENLAAIPDTKERFRGAHIINWLADYRSCTAHVSGRSRSCDRGRNQK